MSSSSDTPAVQARARSGLLRLPAAAPFPQRDGQERTRSWWGRIWWRGAPPGATVTAGEAEAAARCSATERRGTGTRATWRRAARHTTGTSATPGSAASRRRRRASSWSAAAPHHMELEGLQHSLSVRRDVWPCIGANPWFRANSDHWRKNIPVLAKSNRVYAIDLIGYGYSDKPNPREFEESFYTFETWEEQLNTFCAKVVQSEAFFICNSIGGKL